MLSPRDAENWGYCESGGPFGEIFGAMQQGMRVSASGTVKDRAAAAQAAWSCCRESCKQADPGMNELDKILFFAHVMGS